MQNITNILEEGIALKRAGRTTEALCRYAEARKIDPEDYRSYDNSARLLTGTKEYDLALRNFLVLCTSNYLRDILRQDMYAEAGIQTNAPRFMSNTITVDNRLVHPGLIATQTKLHSYMLDLIYRADNLTFYIGHSVVAQKPELIGKYNIPEEHMRNLESALLGKFIGNDLRHTNFEYIFLLAGFVFIDINFRPSFNTVSEAANYYFSDSTSLIYDFSN